MSLFAQPSANQLNVGLTSVRTVVGTIFVAHGAQKLFVFGLAGVAGAFGHMGIPAPELTGPLVAFVELFGGLALIVGLLTRLAAGGLAVTMLGAILFVHVSAGLFLPNGAEFALALLGVLAFLAVTGAGAYSLDSIIGGRRAEAEPVRLLNAVAAQKS
ncbi:MAG: DoxX family protein [Acidobacteria bacterium]|nr:DoxX family protein [Acidobacteriota bacterium]